MLTVVRQPKVISKPLPADLRISLSFWRLNFGHVDELNMTLLIHIIWSYSQFLFISSNIRAMSGKPRFFEKFVLVPCKSSTNNGRFDDITWSTLAPLCRLLALELMRISYAGKFSRILGLIATSSAANFVELVDLVWNNPKLSAVQPGSPRAALEIPNHKEIQVYLPQHLQMLWFRRLFLADGLLLAMTTESSWNQSHLWPLAQVVSALQNKLINYEPGAFLSVASEFEGFEIKGN